MGWRPCCCWCRVRPPDPGLMQHMPPQVAPPYHSYQSTSPIAQVLSGSPPPVNKMYEVFPAYDHLICWEDEIHGGTGPTQAGAAQGATPAAPAAHTTQAPQAARQAGGGSREATVAAAAAAGAAGGGEEAAGWLGVRGEQVVGGGRPLSQQRSRLLAQGEEELEVEAGAAADEAGAKDAAAVPSRQPQQDSTSLFDWQKKPAKLLQFVSGTLVCAGVCVCVGVCESTEAALALP
jgi:hypothetical protein